MTIPEFSKLISLPPARVLTTAEILYHMPDHPDLLQTFIWQHFDILPDFPALRRFLVYWEKNLDGPIHSYGSAGRRSRRPANCAIHVTMCVCTDGCFNRDRTLLFVIFVSKPASIVTT
ncbi:MAG: hypothetical protein ISR47_06175 [Rhodospirillales bacterium]|nr:hypothetical protein [Rhodospirillales bacterium]